jgi:6-phosphogluconolactonase
VSSEILLCRDLEDLSWEMARLFAGEAVATVAKTGRYTVALSGGNTPRRAYEILGSDFQTKVPWKDVHVFWGDERFVPSDHPDSNYRMAWEALLSRVPLSERNVHPVKTEGVNARTASTEYDRHLKEFFRLGAHGVPVFDLVILGVGLDGHTASLFPGSPALRERDRLFTENLDKKRHLERLTMTFPVLNAARQVVFLVSGVEKAVIVREILEGRGETYPVARIQPSPGRLIWLMDEAAASRLPASILSGAKRTPGVNQ